MLSDSVFVATFDGVPLIAIDQDGKAFVDVEGCRRARIPSASIDIDSSKLKGELARLRQIGTAALCNPYRDALGDLAAIRTEIPVARRGALRAGDVKAIVDAIVRIAARSVQ